MIVAFCYLYLLCLVLEYVVLYWFKFKIIYINFVLQFSLYFFLSILKCICGVFNLLTWIACLTLFLIYSLYIHIYIYIFLLIKRKLFVFILMYFKLFDSLFRWTSSCINPSISLSDGYNLESPITSTSIFYHLNYL